MKTQHIENNPLLKTWNTTHHTIPFDSIKTEHFTPALDKALEKAYHEINAIIDNKEKATFENTILAMEESGKRLSLINNIMDALGSSLTSPELMNCLKDAAPKMAKFSSYISLNQTLFKKVKSLYNQRNSLNLDPESLKLLENNYIGFVRSGANLSGKDKKRYEEITSELSELSLSFGDNVLNDSNSFTYHITNKKDLSGLPDYAIEAAADLAKSKGKKGWMFNLQFPSFYPVLVYADKREIREKLFFANATRANKKNQYNNQEIIRKITSLRLELANLLGYQTYADYVLDRRMAKSVKTVNDFIQQLHQASKPKAMEEFEIVKAYAYKQGFKEELKNWDLAYYSEKLKQEKFGFKEEEVKPYFQLEKVTNGVFGLFNTLYGISFKANTDIQVYHKDVKVYEVFDADESLLGVLYQDFYPRESKRSGAWCGHFVPQSNVNGKMVRPHVYIVGNFTKPTQNKPALLTHREVQTYLHEMGHAMHELLSNTTYASLSGTSVYWDFVELPSHMHENWSYEKAWLNTFASHYETGEKIPDELLQKIIDAKNFQAAMASERQLSLGMCDMAWHSITEPLKISIKDFEHEAMKEASFFPRLEETSTSTSFGHLFSGGYAAGYYSYKWSEVLDADAFAYFKEHGIFSKEVGMKFRNEILAKGGSKHPMELYVNFRGKEPDIDALLKRSGLK